MTDRLILSHRRTAARHKKKAEQALFDWFSPLGCREDLIDYERHAVGQQLAEGAADAAQRLAGGEWS